MGKKMMILGASPLQVPAIRAAKELGYEIILVDYDEEAVGFPLADVKLVVSTLDMEEVYRRYPLSPFSPEFPHNTWYAYRKQDVWNSIA